MAATEIKELNVNVIIAHVFSIEANKLRKVKADIQAALNSLRQVSAPNEDFKHEHEHEHGHDIILWEQMIADATEVLHFSYLTLPYFNV